MSTHTPVGDPAAAPPGTVRRRRPWAITGVVTGLAGTLATLPIFVESAYPADDSTIDVGVVDKVDSGGLRVAFVLGYLAVAGLLALAALWRRHVEPQLPGSTAARIVGNGLLASAACLTFGYGWMGALSLYADGGVEAGTFDDAGLYAYFVLNDFGAFIGWLGVVVAAGAMVWMGLVERTVPLWIGIWSALPVLGVVLGVGLGGVPGFPGVVGGPWLVVAFLGLALSRRPFAAARRAA